MKKKIMKNDGNELMKGCITMKNKLKIDIRINKKKGKLMKDGRNPGKCF